MSKPIPTVSRYMTKVPHSIGQDQLLTDAQEQMDALRIRHLPVLEGGKLVGIISERDIALISSLRGFDTSHARVEDAMTPDPYAVPPETPLDQVAATMAERKYGSAVIVQNNKVVGIFTAIDGLSALAELLHSRLA